MVDTDATEILNGFCGKHKEDYHPILDTKYCVVCACRIYVCVSDLRSKLPIIRGVGWGGARKPRIICKLAEKKHKSHENAFQTFLFIVGGPL